MLPVCLSYTYAGRFLLLSHVHAFGGRLPPAVSLRLGLSLLSSTLQTNNGLAWSKHPRSDNRKEGGLR